MSRTPRPTAAPTRPWRYAPHLRPWGRASILWMSLASSGASAQVPPVPTPVENPITPEGAVLGKILFWDEQLSSDNTVACGTCHLPEFAGSDPRQGAHEGADGMVGTPDDLLGSLGVMPMSTDLTYLLEDGESSSPSVTTRSSPALSGSPWSPLMFWDGRAGPEFADPLTGEVLISEHGALEAQALGPILNEVEMSHPGRTWDDVTQKLAAATPLALASDLPEDVAQALVNTPSYAELFEAAFGDPEITPARIAFAIATYERTLVPDETPFDAFLRGEPDALTPEQLAGMQAFNATTCDTCHGGPLLTDHTFRNIGLPPTELDMGRQEVTGRGNDRGRFRTPSLRNVGLKTEFMHDGSLSTLRDVLDHYNRVQGGPGGPGGPPGVDPLAQGANIPPNQFDAVIAFLADGLTDPRAAAGTFPFDRPTLHASEHACHDGIDNDGDGLVDYGEDMGCASGNDTSETAHDVTCDDGIDNDGDGVTDMMDLDCDAGTAACVDDADGDGVCDTDDLLLDVTTVAVASSFTMSVTGQPETLVAFLVSPHGPGEGPCHPTVDVCASLERPLILGTATTDSQGLATYEVTLPSQVPAGRTLHFQALELDTTHGSGEDSNIVMRTVQL